MKKHKDVTMQHVANLANVSIATVSRVLNHPNQTSTAIQRKVLSAIETLNYDTVSLIKSHHNSSPNKKILVIDNQYLSRGMINKGIEDMAKAEGYKLFYLRFLFFSEQEIKQIITYTVNHQIDGILIINDSPYLEKLEQYYQALPPIILLNYYSRVLSCLYFDHLMIAFEATDYFIQRGHKKIACLFGLPDKQCTLQLIQGYQQALKRYAIKENPDYLKLNCIDYQSAKQQLRQLMQLPVPPTAIFCQNTAYLNYNDEHVFPAFDNTNLLTYTDENSIIKGLLFQTKKLRYQIPTDLSFITMANHPGHEMMPHNAITHIHIPMYQMGQRAFSLLLSQIDKQSKQYQSIIINSTIIDRHSVAIKNMTT